MPEDNYTVPTEDNASQAEHDQVKALLDAYSVARKFDEQARKQYAKDRRYAAGTVDSNWAVDTNLIGSDIDVLSSYLYARDPDVSVRPAEQVERPESAPPQIPPEAMAQIQALALPPEIVQQLAQQIADSMDPGKKRRSEMQDFSRTLEIVIAKLWRRGKLKKAGRKIVRGSLSVGPGWLKVIMQTDRLTDPVVQTSLNDARDNLAKLQAEQKAIDEGEVEDVDKAIADLELTIKGLEAKVEVAVRKALAIDVCAAEDVQVSLDVREITDYLESGWMGNAIYRPKTELRSMFPNLTAEEIQAATCYYQRKPDDLEKTGAFENVDHKDADQFGKEGAFTGKDGDAVEFAKIIEIWDRRDNLIKTVIDGVKRWAKAPYAPPQASSRFYPYFLLAFYEVDGARHPQSLSWREHKLQDEFNATRSSYRLTRERSVPGTVFNSAQVPPDEAKKLTANTNAEWIGLKPTNQNFDFRQLFAEKPVPHVDPALYDTLPILRDMDRVSGVQEAQGGSVEVEKTATEADIQESGFKSRVNATRDQLEALLQDLAQYTAELALQTLTVQEVQRMAGPEAFWPADMDIEDLLTLVEVEIDAGSTGKPNTAAEREAWSVALPLIRETMVAIQEAEVTGNKPMADALTELLRETLRRLDDRVDVERFIPQMPAALPGLMQPAVSQPGQPAPAGQQPQQPTAQPNGQAAPAQPVA